LLGSEGLYELEAVENSLLEPTEFLNLGSESFGYFCGTKVTGKETKHETEGGV
jgi:hypothetical protein